MREEEVRVTEDFRHFKIIELRFLILTAAAILRYRFRCLNAPAAKPACGLTRWKGSEEDDVRIAPTYGAQALVH